MDLLEKSIKNGEFRSGIVDAVPVSLGYFVVAVSFGILSKTINTGFLPAVLMSVSVFAGASQFIAINLIATGAQTGEIILTTFFVNLRHLLMSASLAPRITTNRFPRQVLAFGITDETFSVASAKEGKIHSNYLIALEAVSYSAWVLGTLSGYQLGHFLPEILQEIFGVILYSLFVSLLVPHLRKGLRYALPPAIAAGLNTLLRSRTELAPGWCIVLAILLGAGLGAFILDGKAKEEDQK